MERDLQTFVEVLMSAAAEVLGEYFHLPQAESDAVYRERVYCYELYHRMRTRWEGAPYSLGGEIDKAGHPLFRGGPYARAKPDFLVHIPGEMDHNLAVVEVKPATAASVEVQRDFQKLKWFCEKARYFAGIMLIYGESKQFERDRNQIVEALRAMDAPLILLHQSRPGASCHILESIVRR